MSAIVLVGLPRIGTSAARLPAFLRVIVVLDTLNDLLGPVVRRGQIIKWAAGEQGKDGYMRRSGNPPTQSHQYVTFVAYWVRNGIIFGFCVQCNTARQVRSVSR